MFSALGTLDTYMDFTTYWSFAESYINKTLLYGFLSGKLGPAHMIYGADLMHLCMTLAAAAYVVVKSVDAGVSFTRGFYHTYAGGSANGNLLYLWEVFVILAW